MTTPLSPLDALADATEARPEAIDRLAARLVGLPVRSHQDRPARILAGTALLAAAGLVAFLVLWPEPGMAPLSGRLDVAVPTAFTSIPEVQATLLGGATLGGSRQNPRFVLDSGTLDIALTPGCGLHLSVETDEALVAVHGTTFRVVRDRLGTTVSVREGAVEVTCHDGRSEALGADRPFTCLPVRPAGLLGRAHALREVGDPEGALRTLDLALAAAAPGDPARGEALALRAVLFVEHGRAAEAAEAAHTYIAEGHTARLAEMRSLVASTTP